MANYISQIKLPNGSIYQLKDKNALPLTGGTVTGSTSFNDSVDIDDLNVGTLLVNGNATLVNGVQIGENTQVDKINGVTVGDNPKFTDTIYTFDGTYNASSNKAATVQTVTNAINNLDVTAKTGAASQTITSISQTNGKIDVTYSNISITKSQISNFPTSWDLSNISGADDLKAIEALTETTGFLKKTNTNTWSLDTNTYLTAATLPAASTSTAGITKVGASGGAAAYDHVHGHLTNAGAITTTATIASGDKLVIVDSNDSSKINGSITFGSDQTKFLTNKGTWVVPTGTYSLPTATSSALGGIKIGYTENGKNYPVELNNGQAYVNVPWTDNNTTYTAGTGLSLSGTKFNHSNSIAAGTAGTSSATSSTNRQITIPYITYDTQGHITASGTHTHTIESFPEAYLTWGGKSFSGTFGPMDAAMVPELGANRFAFLDPAGIEIEYSRDGGQSWNDYDLSDINKKAFFTENGFSLRVGKADTSNPATSDYLLRITITTNLAKVYTTLYKFLFSVGTNGNSGCYVKIEKALKQSEDNYVTVESHSADSEGRVSLVGWSGYNIINVPSFTTYGNASSWQYSKIRFTFGCTGGTGQTNGGSGGGFSIYRCYAFGGMGWTTPSTLAKYGRIYTYDVYQNVTFPAKVTATEFVGDLNWSNITNKPTTLSGYGITDSILKWQTSTTASTNIYDFGVYVAHAIGGAAGPTNDNYYAMLNIPYRKAFGNTKADYGWSIAGSTSNDKRLFYRTSDGNTWGDWVEIAHINAGTAVGNATQPVYVSSTGVVTACTSYANASVNHATSADSATKATQDSDGNQINITYLKLTGGTLSGKLTVGTTSQSAAPTAAIHVHDIRNYTIPTTMFSSGVNWFFTAKETPTAKYWSGMHINGWNGDYNAWELVGPSHNEDQKTTPLYVRTGRTTGGWGSWRKIYDSSNAPTKSEIGLGNVEDIALSTWTGSNKITTVGTISSGTWNGTVIGASYGGTGKTNLKDACNALINALDTGSSNLTSNDYVITQYVGGGTTTTTYHRRPASALRVGGLLTGRKLKVALGSTTDVTFDGTADVTGIPISGTLGVAHGGTGATSFTSGALLIGNGTGAVGTRTIKNLTAKGNLGWTSQTTDIYIPTINTLAYWDGRYNSTSSNLTYCVKGAFGDAAIKGVDTTTLTATSTTNLPTSKAVADFVENAKGTLTFALDTTDTKKLIITYSH